VNGVFVTPYKWWSGPPFITRRGEGLVVYSLIVRTIVQMIKLFDLSPQVPLGTQDLVAMWWPVVSLWDELAYLW
jgi:hypothetical protein